MINVLMAIAMPLWQPTEKFHMLSEAAYLFPEREAFRALCPRISVRPRENKDGTWTLPVESVKPPKNADGSPRPFYLTLWTRMGLLPGMFFKAKLDPTDAERFRKFRAEHPEMIGIITSEWVNDSKWGRIKNPNGHPRWLVQPGKKQTKIRGPKFTLDEYLAVMDRPEFVHAKDSRSNYLDYFKMVFDRTVDLCYHAPEEMIIGDGCYCTDHLVADWGAGGIWMETSRNYMMWQVQMMFARGAASQYNIPFHWYVATFWAGFDSSGEKFKRDGHQTPDHPERGISYSAVERVTYLTYLSGAATYEREGPGSNYKYCEGERKGKISPEGEFISRFYDFQKKCSDRGVPLRPVAVVVPRDRGYCRNGGLPFYNDFAYTRSDYLMDALMAVLLEYPRNKAVGMAKSGVERVMANSKFGDVFDVIVPGGKKPETFRRALKEHQVAFLAGEFDFSPEDRRAIEEFKAQGGKLIDVGALVEWLGPERSLANICPEEFDFWNDFNLPKGKTDVYLGLDRLTAAAEAAVLPLHPFKVEGDVQFGFNRTGYGYLVYLINNAGVKKYGDTLEQIAPGGSDVVITAKDGSTHKVTVGYGSLKVLKFLEKENRWEECL